MPLSPEQEAKAVAAIRTDTSQGNPAFQVIFHEHERRLRGFVRMRARCEADVDEILNDTWLKAWRALPKLDVERLRREKAGLAPFLYRVALTSMIDYYRRSEHQMGRMTVFLEDLQSRSKSDPFGVPDAGRVYDTVADCGQSPEQIYADWELKESILRIAFGETGRPPHEVIVFGLIVCLGCKPQELSRGAIADASIAEAERDLEEGMAASASLPASVLASVFGPLRESMTWNSSRVSEHLIHPSGPTVGQTFLRDYFSRPDHPGEDIRIWRYNVFRRTVLLARRP
jgi:DNA-directed RNA polymerase specialized sigma24 family protein